MAVYKIVELGDPVLRQKSSPVPEVNDSIKKLLDNLADTLYAAKGVGLAAPQIGVAKRVIVVDCGEACGRSSTRRSSPCKARRLLLKDA